VSRQLKKYRIVQGVPAAFAPPGGRTAHKSPFFYVSNIQNTVPLFNNLNQGSQGVNRLSGDVGATVIIL